MVIVRLAGGLGNQLFQYATGRALAYRLQTTLKLDLGDYGDRVYRPYGLEVFSLPAEPARMRDVPLEFRLAHLSGPMRRVCQRVPRQLLVGRRAASKVIREKSTGFDRSVLEVIGDVYLVGFWQSPKYFEDVASVIRADLALSPERAGAAEDITAEVRQQGTVSVHVRRGDYVTDPVISSRHGTCSPGYYANALEWLSSRIEVKRVFVFSDDIEWARNELKFASPTVFVTEPGEDSVIRDFFLMSQCEHHVIANSTFSWWAAWLRRNPDGCVVVPGRWFSDTTVDTRDLYPTGWAVL
jgi:hypothetical protein